MLYIEALRIRHVPWQLFPFIRMLSRGNGSIEGEAKKKKKRRQYGIYAAISPDSFKPKMKRRVSSVKWPPFTPFTQHTAQTSLVGFPRRRLYLNHIIIMKSS